MTRPNEPYGVASLAWLCLCVGLWLPAVKSAAEAPSTELDRRLAQARAGQLWNRREWRVLLHYLPSLTGQQTASAVDDPAFFLAPDGKTSPRHELEATLTALSASKADTDQAAACRFPARAEWLAEALSLPRTALPHYSCRRLRRWLEPLRADSVTLIFPVSMIDSPASLFGHTFLRFDREREKQPDLLAWTVNYAAQTNRERGFGFALKGLFGGYRGKFSLAPYYSHVKAYGDIESRDIWEYRFAFSRREIHRLLLHLWEIVPVYFDYYFVDENCAYQVLALLEAARPSLRLTEKFRWDAIPTDVVHRLVKVPQLLKSIKYRPSARQIILARGKSLDADDRALARQLALAEAGLDDGRLARLPAKEQAAVVELAYDYAAYLENDSKRKKIMPGWTPPKERASLLYDLLNARRRLPASSRQPAIAAPAVRPDQGHAPHRLSLSLGYEEPRPFLEGEFRGAYHDLYDPSGGFNEGAQLEFLRIAGRYYPEQNRLAFESLGLVDIVSAPSFDSLLRPFSWKISAAVKRRRFSRNYRPVMADFEAGLGIAHAFSDVGRLLILAEAEVDIGDDFNQYTALGGGAEAILLASPHPAWLTGLSAKITHYFQGVTQTAYQFSFRQRVALGTNQAVLLTVSEGRDFGNPCLAAMISWRFYF